MNFDGSELADEDGPHAAWRRRILGGGRAIVLRQFRVRGAAADGRQPTKGSSAPAASRRNRERDRAGLRKR